MFMQRCGISNILAGFCLELDYICLIDIVNTLVSRDHAQVEGDWIDTNEIFCIFLSNLSLTSLEIKVIKIPIWENFVFVYII
jgi:hypothetical protein